MDGTPNDVVPGTDDVPEVAELIEELEAADPAEAPPIAEKIADALGAELDAGEDGHDSGAGP